MSVLLKEYFQLSPDKEMLTELRELHEKGEPLLVKGVIQRAEAKNQNGRIYPKDILEQECSRYQKEFIDRGISLGELDHCYSKGYQVLTTDGWKLLEDMKGTEEVYTINTETNEIELSPVLKTHKFHYVGNLIKLTNGKKLEQLMTPNHRMLFWDRDNQPYYMMAKDAYELHKENSSMLNHSYLKASGEWIGEFPTYFNIPNTEYNIPIKAWAGMFGLWLAEGSVDGSKGSKSKNYRIQICQKKKENIKLIQDLLDATELPWTVHQRKDETYYWTLCDKNIHSYFSQFGNSSTKFIPRSFLMWNKELLSLMFDWMLLGDGKNRKDPVSGKILKEYATISPQLADDVSEVLFKLGSRSFIKVQKPQDFEIKGRKILKENCHDVLVAAENKSKTYMDARFIKFEEVAYDDFVYCISTKNKNFLSRSPDGYVCWTGNTDEPVIALKNVSHLIRKLWWEDNDVMGEVQLLNTPAGKIAQEIVLSGIPLGISSRAIGSVSKNEDKAADVVQDDLQLICFDLVGTPSTDGAFLGMNEAKEIKNFNPRKVLPPEMRIKQTLSEILKKEVK